MSEFDIRSEAEQFGDRDFVYTFEVQKGIALKLAYDLVIAGDEPEDAIETAKKFVDEFYHLCLS